MTIGKAQKIINELKPQFNEFKTTQDRKYALYELLRLRSEPFKIEKYIGSNQIIIEDINGKVIYNSDNETTEQKNNFEQWFKKIIITWLLVNLSSGL